MGPRAVGLAVSAALVACGERVAVEAAPEPPARHEAELAALRQLEDAHRKATDFATLSPSEIAHGPDPYRIGAVRDRRSVGLLRGESAIVLLDERGAELARSAAPRSPGGLAVAPDGTVLVVGEGSRELAHYRATDHRLERAATSQIDALAMRDIAVAADGNTAYVVEDHVGRVLAVTLARDRTGAIRAAGTRELGRCHGPVQVEALSEYVVVNCLLDRTLEIRRNHDVVARISHDGPIWGFALHREPDGALLIAAGGVEDHPLERRDGGFGYIDSFVYLYRLAPGASQPQRLATINASELGVVTPKWLTLRPTRDGGVSVITAGFGSPELVTLTWPKAIAGAPQLARAQLPPGTAAAVLRDDDSVVAANPLLDGWVVARGGQIQVVPIPSELPPRPVASRIGELLFFTGLMAPWSSSEGKLSRFTCETCHFEGYIDGRVHYTGRDDVHATTRPLLGLFNNRPHFSRALDKTLAQMVHAEFRVANRHNGRDPWFALTRRDVPWLELVDGAPVELTPMFLREALMTFFMGFTHRSNPAVFDHPRFTEVEQQGARLFQARCERCHAARLIADDPGSMVGFERWEPLVLSASGPIVWGSSSYEKTGVTPYVHEAGARVPPLRRLYKKWPYFTNGSARSLAEVLDRFAWTASGGYHDHAPAESTTRLTAEEKASLLAFLNLL